MALYVAVCVSRRSPFGSSEALLVMRRDLSRLSTSLKLFIRHPYSRSSKASNPRLPRWWWDRQRSRQEGGLQVCSGDVEHAEHDGAFRIDNVLSGVISVRLRNKGLRKNVQAEKPGTDDVAQMREFKRAGKRGVPHRPSRRRWPQALPELTYHPIHNNTFVILDVQTQLGAIKQHLELPWRL